MVNRVVIKGTWYWSLSALCRYLSQTSVFAAKIILSSEQIVLNSTVKKTIEISTYTVYLKAERIILLFISKCDKDSPGFKMQRFTTF